jgi:hypothetical protein
MKYKWISKKINSTSWSINFWKTMIAVWIIIHTTLFPIILETSLTNMRTDSSIGSSWSYTA